MDKIGRIETL
jgi:DNA-directed RNA polymerase I subunit RPA1